MEQLGQKKPLTAEDAEKNAKIAKKIPNTVPLLEQSRS
jgi:hypothetical protein